MRSRIGFLIVLLLSWASDVAGVCMVTAPCARYWASDAVFVGTVTDIQRTRMRSDLPEAAFVSAERVQLSVVEAYRGLADRSVTVLNVLHSEAAEFRVGGTFFVYASRAEDGSLRTSLCAGTRSVAEAEEDRAYARWIRTPRTHGRVVGTIGHVQWDPASNEDASHPLPDDLVIALAGTAGSWRTRPDRTEGVGRFVFEDVPPGSYVLRVETGGPYEDVEPVEFQLQPPQLCREEHISLYWNGRVRGRVTDVDGSPLPGVPVVIVSAGERPRHAYRWEAMVSTDDRGEFDHTRLAAGDYILGIHIDNVSLGERRRPAIYFPGVIDVSAAHAVSVALNEELDVGDFRVPFSVEKIEVTGVVLLPDGSPAAGCLVFPLADDDVFEATLAMLTDGNGHFRLWLVAGREYRVDASCKDGDVFYEVATRLAARPDSQLTIRLQVRKP